MTERTIADVVRVETDGGVATVWLDRPDARNALAPEFWLGFPSVIGTLDADDDIRSVVVASTSEDAFCSGLDLEAFGPVLMSGAVDPGSDEASAAAVAKGTYSLIRMMQSAFTAIADSPKPVITAVAGWCIGAGVELITACDIRYAAENAVFSVRETRLAIVADTGTLQRLPEIVDPGRAAELVYTGRDFDAAEAHEMGLVSRVLPDREAAIAAARETAQLIAENSPLVVQGAKHILRKRHSLSVAEQLDYVALWNTAFLNSDDLIEAISAHVENRPPEFTGN